MMDVFYSMWRSRTVACPWGSDKPAVETVLLHHEQFKIPENLSRFAVRHGMWGFVRKMSQTVPSFVAARRERGVPSFEPDPDAFGSGCAPNPPISRCATSRSSLSLMSVNEVSSDCASESDAPGPGDARPSATRRLRGLAAFAIASSLALIVHRKGSQGGGESLGLSRAASLARGARGLPRSSSMPAGLMGAGRGRRSLRFLSELETE